MKKPSFVDFNILILLMALLLKVPLNKRIQDNINQYKDEVEGLPAKIVAMNLIVTPEYLKRITLDHPDVDIHVLRVDRGASSPEILATELGERWEEESGLNSKQYILPGGGGFGEIINNSYC